MSRQIAFANDGAPRGRWYSLQQPPLMNAQHRLQASLTNTPRRPKTPLVNTPEPLRTSSVYAQQQRPQTPSMYAPRFKQNLQVNEQQGQQLLQLKDEDYEQYSMTDEHPYEQQPPLTEMERFEVEWHKTQKDLKKMRLDRSPTVPSSFAEFVEHKYGIIEAMKELHKDKVEGNEPVRFDIELVRSIGMEDLIAEYSVWERVNKLGPLTTWAPTWQPSVTHPQANWPNEQELKEEGDERHTSGFGRFLPIPRIPGNPTVNWKQKPFLNPLPMDFVRPVPRKLSHIALPADHDVHEPTVDENGTYVDDTEEIGKICYGQGEDPRASQVKSLHERSHSADALVRPHQVGGHHQHGGHNRTNSQHRSSFGSALSSYRDLPESDSQTSLESLSNGLSWASPPINLLTGNATSRSMQRVAHEETKPDFRSEKLQSAFGDLQGGGTTLSAYEVERFAFLEKEVTNLVEPRNDRYPAQGEGRWGRSAKPIALAERRPDSPDLTLGDGAFPSANPWRRVTYGRNSFGRRDTIQEESFEEVERATLGRSEDAILPKSLLHRTPSLGPIQRPSTQHVLPQSRSVSPKSPQTVIEHPRSQHRRVGSASGSDSDITEFGNFGLRI